jgi:hypothetical protein
MRLLRAVTAFTAIAWIGAITLTPVPSWGTEPDTHVAEASRHFHRGVELSEDGDWRAALIEFERAYAIAPNFHVLYDIGQCRYQLHDYPGALDAFRKYLADGHELVPPERRAAVESDIESLKGRVAFLRILSSESGAEISIDDTVIGTTPLKSAAVVSSGRHKIRASKPGSPEVVQYVDVAGEETRDLTLNLAPPARASQPSAALAGPALVVAPTRRSRSIAPALVAFGVAAVGVGIGSYLGIVAIRDKHDLEGTCVVNSCPASSKPLLDDAQHNALGSTLAFGAAILGAGVGGGYLLFTRPREAAATPAAATALRIVVGPGSLGAEGTF